MTLSRKHVNVNVKAAAGRLLKKQRAPLRPPVKGKKPVPWTKKDAPRHTKAAKSAADKKLWSAVANKVLSNTGNEASAVKIANSQVNKHKGKR